MSTIVQVCVVILTLSFVAMAVAAWRIVGRVNDLVEKASLGIGDLQRVAGDASRVVDSLHDVALGIQRGAAQFQAVGTRAARVSHMVLDEIERPARGAVALVHGVKAGAAALLGRRLPHPSIGQMNGGERHVGSA